MYIFHDSQTLSALWF